MKSTRLIVAVAPAFLLGFGGGCVDGGAVVEPAAPAAALHANGPAAQAPAGNPRILASGWFEAESGTQTYTPQGNHCIVQVDGRQHLSGTLEGTVSGTSNVRVFARCPDVQAGSVTDFRSVFRSNAFFEGTVAGEAVQADLVYEGRAEAGGQLHARLHFSGGLRGILHVAGVAAEGGTYEGFVIRR